MISASKIMTQIVGAGLIAMSTSWISDFDMSGLARGAVDQNMVVGYFLVGAVSFVFHVVVGGRAKIVRSQVGLVVISLMMMVMGWILVSSIFDRKPEGKFSCEGMGEIRPSVVF